MKNQTALKIIFLSLILSSCGLVGNGSKPSTQPTDSAKEASTSSSATDDLFNQAMEDTNNTNTAHTDAPQNIDTSSDIKSLEDEFSPSGPNETVVKESKPKKASHKEAPIVVQDNTPDIQAQDVTSPNMTSEVKTYHVQKGETLMQIAFKLYGDISKWKDLKTMNNAKISGNTSLRANTQLKYHAPDSPFVWNPSGTPYMIKTGETLGVISNNVYSTPKKWKMIWENNKPLIKNPNVIYAGFTLYYPPHMANYVQPAPVAKKITSAKADVLPFAPAPKRAIENVKAASFAEKNIAQVENNTFEQEAESSFLDSREEEIQVEKATKTSKAIKNGKVLTDETTEGRSAPQREIDLIHNISVPQEDLQRAETEREMAPDVDEELQTLN